MADGCPEGVLVECEPAIKSILVHIDSTHHHEFIIEDLDETHLFVKEAMLQVLKSKLEEVSLMFLFPLAIDADCAGQRLRETYRPEEPLEDSE
jgi:TFIIH basal transcription factor complex TTD-A subunit